VRASEYWPWSHFTKWFDKRMEERRSVKIRGKRNKAIVCSL